MGEHDIELLSGTVSEFSVFAVALCVTGGRVQWPPQWSSVLDNQWEPKERVLDRYTSHTQHCATCLRAVARFQLVQRLLAFAAAAAAMVSFFALPWPWYAVGFCVALALGGASSLLGKLIAQFYYTGYDHAVR